MTSRLGASSSSSYSSSSSFSSSSFTHSSWKYDIFICYKGADTYSNFTYNLYSNLVQKGIKTYSVRRGEELSLPIILKSVEESRMSLIIFSENFASSECCLDELVKILQCRESKQQIVWPVYYKVDPLDVRNQTGTFGEAMAMAHFESKYSDNMEKVLRWRTALTEATNLPSWYFLDGLQSKFIHNIVEEISSQVLNRSHLNVPKYPVGIESRVQDMNELLGIGVNDVRMVGIWGTQGIGKTTVAKAVYNSISHNFEGSFFAENVGENSITRGLVQLQKIVLSKILGGEQSEVKTVDHGSNVIKKRLSRKRVLLVLDGVNQLEQLNKLVGGSNWFGLGSRIIITTPDKSLLTAHGVNLTYRVKELDFDEAFDLFSWNAFRRNNIPDEYTKLAIAVVNFAQGLPLALIVLASLLCGKSVDEWKAALDGYREAPNLGIQEILKMNYDALEDPVKEVFLDIACFLNGKPKNYVTKMLESCHLNPEYAIEVLVDKFLIKIKEDHIWMKEWLEDTGKEMVREDSLCKPEKRSRLWFYKDVKHVLTENTGTSKSKGIMDEMYTSVKSFSKAASTKSKWGYIITSLCLEILSLAFDQASSPSNPQYAAFGMSLAFAAVLVSILELICQGKREKVELRRWGMLWWFFYPHSHHRLFGSLPEIYGLVGGISQCIFSTFQYVCFIRHDQNPIKVSLWPAIFLVCLAASRLSWKRMDETIEQNE